MSRPRALFSAPHDFLVEFKATYATRLELRFREIWHEDELPAVSEEEIWIPNPGQHFVVDRAVLERFPNLRVIATPSTGTNHIDREACAIRGVAVYGLLDDRPALDRISASAEFTFLLLLNALRRLDVALEHARSGSWRHAESELRGHELDGKTVGLVGFGRIGRRLARWCAAFGATASFYDPYADGEIEPESRVDTLEALFERSEIVVVCCALTDETRGFIDGDLLRLLPNDGVVINSSRGEILDERSVAEVLRERAELVFATDVISGEVRNEHEDSELMKLFREGRIVVTPHVAGVTVESQTKAARAAAELALQNS